MKKQTDALANANKCELCFVSFSITMKRTELEKHVTTKHDKKGTFETCFPAYDKVQEMLKDITCKNKPKNAKEAKYEKTKNNEEINYEETNEGEENN